LQTFFKHFVIAGTSEFSGYRVLDGLPKRTAWENNYLDYVNGTFTERIEVLVMNETATWLSFAIILILIYTLVALIVSLEVVYPSHCVHRNVECLADVLAMVAGSDGLIELIQKNGIENLEKSDARTKLGWFKDRRGAVRWGVELEDAERVEWVDPPEEFLRGNVRDERFVYREMSYHSALYH